MIGILTNDDAGAAASEGAIEQFGTVVDWLDGLGIPCTFFWVPTPGNAERAHELWNPVVREARDRGHDFQLHGLA